MFRRVLRLTVVLLCAALIQGGSSLPPGDQIERIRAFTRAIEFDYVTWTLEALEVKAGQLALGTSNYFPADTQTGLVIDYLNLINKMSALQADIQRIFADPNISDPEQASETIRKELEDTKAQRAMLEPLAEAVIQGQISATTARLGLTIGGQPIPPVLYHTTPPPDALIISPRHVIRQDADISIDPNLTLEQIEKLEEAVDRKMNVSSLVVGIGGIGLYPTMVMQTSDINWLVEVVAHEWVHNFLTLRPLGFSYLASPELRIMNETAASIAGKEIGRAVIEHYYPQYLPPPPATDQTAPAPSSPADEPERFNFRKEMRTTRVTVDQLLAEGKIEAAEAYMEERRRLFWDNGYLIRKLNQAYFAFYGAYADQEGGASGADPVGAAVRNLRAQSPSLAIFLNRISWMWSFEQLQKVTLQGKN